METENYLTHYEMKEIAVQEFKDRIRNLQQQDLERIVNNSAYQVIWSAVDEAMDGTAESILKEKVISVINGMSFFNVFSAPNAWDRKEQQAYGVIMQTVRENKHLIDETIKEGFKGLTRKQKAEIAYNATISGLSK